MRAKGWWSGDMHVHRPVEDAAGIAQAEDLNFKVLVNRGKQDLFRPDHWPQEPVTNSRTVIGPLCVMRRMSAAAVPGYSMD
jgi:hypothetical protein